MNDEIDLKLKQRWREMMIQNLIFGSRRKTEEEEEETCNDFHFFLIERPPAFRGKATLDIQVIQVVVFWVGDA